VVKIFVVGAVLLLSSGLRALAAETEPTPQPAPPPALGLPPGHPQPLPPGPGENPTTFFYYCDKTKAYFPHVNHCPEGWIAVPVSSEAAPLDWSDLTPAELATEETVKSQPNSLNVELVGRALVYSLNFDRAISPHCTIGVGISSWRETNWWQDYHATVTVVPAYVDYFFSQQPRRAFVSAGADWIHVSRAGYSDNTFTNTGFAAVIGGGYELRDVSGFLLRLGGYVIVGRSVVISPSVAIGFAF
jgi:hypothetical protein